MAASGMEPEALRYLARGWSVIPLRAHDKRPLVRWQPYQLQKAGADRLRRWFRDWPDANIGIVTGAVSGLVVLDVDPRHGGAESLADLERAHGPLPDTVAAVTGGGGRHFYFRHPGGTLHNRVGLAPGIDLRGDGGLVVAPPSVHPSGRRYEWTAGRRPDEMALAPLPAWLLGLAREEHRPRGRPVTHWRRLVTQGVAQGERNNSVASLAGHLLWHGIDPEVALELLLCWNRVKCRPPLPDAEVAAVVESIRRLHRGETGGAND